MGAEHHARWSTPTTPSRASATRSPWPAPAWARCRIDSGDLVSEAWRARRLLDELGATSHPGDRHRRPRRPDARGPWPTRRPTATGWAPAWSPASGTRPPGSSTSWSPSATAPAAQRPVAKRSPGKATVGGRKWAWRIRASPVRPSISTARRPATTEPCAADLLAVDDRPPPQARTGPCSSGSWRVAGRGTGSPSTRPANLHRTARDELPEGEPLISYRRTGART